MRTGVLVCDPGDRPEFKDQYTYYIRYQTFKPQVVYLADVPPVALPDLNGRMRYGLDQLKDKCDIIVIMENDDWYSRRYLDQVVKGWLRAGEPEIFGYSVSRYYHLRTRMFARISHPGRSSLFTTAIKASAVNKIKWPATEEPFLDVRLWQQLKGVAVEPATVEAIGMKHGLGHIISSGHEAQFHRYKAGGESDESLKWLAAHVGDEFAFYKSLSEKLRLGEV